PPTGEWKALSAAPRKARAPSFSLDGTRVAYQRLDPGGTKVMVVDLARRTPIHVAAVASPTDLLQWSPDGSKLAWISGTQAWIANTDGSGAQALDVGMPVEHEIEWPGPP